MNKFLQSPLTLLIIAGIVWLAYSNYTLQKTVATLQQDVQILIQGHNQIVINTQNIATLAEIINPDINTTLPQLKPEDEALPEVPDVPVVQNSSEAVAE